VLLVEALESNPERLDLQYSLAVTQLDLGEPEVALPLILDAEKRARAMADESAAALLPQLVLARASALQDLDDAGGAEASFMELLTHEPDNPRARNGLGHLLLAWGEWDRGLTQLDEYLADGADAPEVLDATTSFVDAARRFRNRDLHPRNFLEAHRESYVEFFDHHAERMQSQGWWAEAARMIKDDGGNLVPRIPEGARPYAGIREDLVHPESGQPGLIGEQPMQVALADYEPLAMAPVLVDWPDTVFPFHVSSQCPWNHLKLQVRMSRADAVDELDAVIGDWYRSGFEGAFGSNERGYFHQISPPHQAGPDRVAYHLDCGRADLGAIDDLLKRLDVLHARSPVMQLVLGRGYLR
jgi:hypothetical protein